MPSIWMRLTRIGTFVLSLVTPVQAATEQSTIAPGGGKSPVTGGRPDEQSPRLGPGNRGTGEPGRPLIDPSKVRSEPSGPGTIVGQVLSIQGESYVVRMPNGFEVVLKSTKATELPAVINMGETVEAEINSAGAVTRIKPVAR
jgi:hypothetical protein